MVAGRRRIRKETGPGPHSPCRSILPVLDSVIARERMAILNAVRRPGSMPVDAADFLTPGNTFPNAFAHHVRAGWAPSPDASDFSSHDSNYRFTRVDSLLVTEEPAAGAPGSPPGDRR